MQGLTFSSKLGWGSKIISVAETASKKIGDLICSINFLSPEVAQYLCKSTMRPCMEYCCHVWSGAPSCYLELLDKRQKWIWRIVGPSQDCCCLSWNLDSSSKCSQLKLSIGITLVDFNLNWFNWLRFLILEGGLHVVQTDCMTVTIPRCYKDVYNNSFFPRKARPWNSLLIEYFPLTYDLSGFKFRINSHLLTAISRYIISQNTDDYGWLQVTTGSYERLQTSSSTQHVAVDVHKQIAWDVCEHV